MHLDADIAAQLPEFRKLAAEAGRDPATLEVSAFGVAGEEKVVKRYRDAGLDRVVFGLPPANREGILPVLDRLAAWIE